MPRQLKRETAAALNRPSKKSAKDPERGVERPLRNLRSAAAGQNAAIPQRAAQIIDEYETCPLVDQSALACNQKQSSVGLAQVDEYCPVSLSTHVYGTHQCISASPFTINAGSDQMT